MHPPAVRDEIEEITGYLAAQLAALRTAAHGLTEEQARDTPCRSALSVGGLLKHTTRLCRSWPARPQGSDQLEDDRPLSERIAEFGESFVIRPDETFEATLSAFDDAVADYLAAVRTADPDADAVEPPAPWYGRPEPIPTRLRYALLHHVEEFARHAGHADILREQLDGATAASLDAAVHGRPANAFVTPWTPTSASAAAG